MKVNVEGNTLFLIPGTDLIASNVETLRDRMLGELKNNPDTEKIVLDAEGIEIVDSLGLNLVIGLYRQVNNESKTFEIVHVGDKFMKVANFFRFPSLFEVKKKGGIKNG